MLAATSPIEQSAAIRVDLGAIFLSMELSRSTWLITLSPGGGEKMSKQSLVGGYFSPDVRRSLHLLALEEGVTIQALLGEALDHLMRARGKHPFGER